MERGKQVRRPRAISVILPHPPIRLIVLVSHPFPHAILASYASIIYPPTDIIANLEVPKGPQSCGMPEVEFLTYIGRGGGG
eukprot:635642-Pyramimonas_sp.AAC.1